MPAALVVVANEVLHPVFAPAHGQVRPQFLRVESDWQTEAVIHGGDEFDMSGYGYRTR